MSLSPLNHENCYIYIYIFFFIRMLQVESVRTEQANTDFSIFCELLKDYMGLIGAVKVCHTLFYSP